MRYKQFEIYTFKVLGLTFDIKSDRYFMQIQDEDGNKYNVKPYLCHIEWGNTVDTIDCVFRGNDALGRPKFVIRKLDMLEQFYEIGRTYTFNIASAKTTDPNTGREYYEIVDRTQDISQRYYTNEDLNEGDTVGLKVSGFTENSIKDAFLKFERRAIAAQPKVDEVRDDGADSDTEEDLKAAREKVGGYEGLHVEWKSSIAYVAGDIVPNIDKQLGVIMRVISSFQNSEGGTLYIGVNDNGQISGINQDFQHLNTGYDVTELDYKYSPTLDSYQLKIHNAVVQRLGKAANSNINIKFAKEGNLYYCIVEVKPSKRPIYLDGNKLYQRAGNMIQILTNDDMTNFVIDRSAKYVHVQAKAPEVITNSSNIIQIEKENTPIIQPDNIDAYSADDIKFYLQLYSDGQWSYSKKPSTEQGIMTEFPIYKDTLKESLVLCYANGCITRISPYEFLNPKRSDRKRKYKKENTKYSNGYNTESQLLAIYSCHDNDYIAIRNTDADGINYAKVHGIGAFTKYEAIQSKGKQAVPTGATNISYTLIKSSQFHFVSALYMKDYMTTSKHGFRVKNIQLKSTFENLEKLDKQ